MGTKLLQEREDWLNIKRIQTENARKRKQLVKINCYKRLASG